MDEVDKGSSCVSTNHHPDRGEVSINLTSSKHVKVYEETREP